jgi:hypothetical protein
LSDSISLDVVFQTLMNLLNLSRNRGTKPMPMLGATSKVNCAIYAHLRSTIFGSVGLADH